MNLDLQVSGVDTIIKEVKADGVAESEASRFCDDYRMYQV